MNVSSSPEQPQCVHVCSAWEAEPAAPFRVAAAGPGAGLPPMWGKTSTGPSSSAVLVPLQPSAGQIIQVPTEPPERSKCGNCCKESRGENGFLRILDGPTLRTLRGSSRPRTLWSWLRSRFWFRSRLRAWFGSWLRLPGRVGAWAQLWTGHAHSDFPSSRARLGSDVVLLSRSRSHHVSALAAVSWLATLAMLATLATLAFVSACLTSASLFVCSFFFWLQMNS